MPELLLKLLPFVWVATPPTRSCMWLQFVIIFLFLSCHERNLPSFPSSPFVAFSTLLVLKATQDSGVTLAVVLELISLMLYLVLVLLLLSCSYLQSYLSSDPTNLLNTWQFLSFRLQIHFLWWAECAFPVQ